MELKLIRKYKAKNYCIGHLYVNGVYECDTLKDSSGCILVGINDTKGRISKSTITLNSLMTKLSKADNITIEII